MNNTKETFLDIVTALLGTALIGMALSVFTVPNDIAPGGVSGLATALAHITPIRVSVWTFGMNIPLLFGAWKLLGKKTLVYTVLATALLSVFIELADRFIPHYTDDVLVASIFGGALSGVGTGLLFIRGITTGGTDLLALMVRRRLPNIPSGTILMFIDCAVVGAAVLIFRNINVALYSTLTIVVSSKLIDTISQGVDYAKVIYIITEKGDAVSECINTQTDRGSTLIRAVGGYTGQNKTMVITVTRRNALHQTLALIKKVDPHAFTYVTDSTEVHGLGFKLEMN